MNLRQDGWLIFVVAAILILSLAITPQDYIEETEETEETEEIEIIIQVNNTHQIECSNELCSISKIPNRAPVFIRPEEK